MRMENEGTDGTPERISVERQPRHRVPAWQRWLVTAISLIALVFLNLWWTSNEAQERDQRWCSLLGTMTEAYKEAPPTSETGKLLARDIEALHRDFHCEGTSVRSK